MDSALVLISVFAIFIPALILPGPDFVAVVRSSMTYGTRAGLLTTLGVSIGPLPLRDAQPARPVGDPGAVPWLTWAVRLLGGAT